MVKGPQVCGCTISFSSLTLMQHPHYIPLLQPLLHGPPFSLSLSNLPRLRNLHAGFLHWWNMSCSKFQYLVPTHLLLLWMPFCYSYATETLFLKKHFSTIWWWNFMLLVFGKDMSHRSNSFMSRFFFPALMVV